MSRVRRVWRLRRLIWKLRRAQKPRRACACNGSGIVWRGGAWLTCGCEHGKPERVRRGNSSAAPGYENCDDVRINDPFDRG